MNPLLTIAQVAEVLQMSERTVYRLIKEGKLVAVQIPSEYRTVTRVRESELDAFLDRLSTAST